MLLGKGWWLDYEVTAIATRVHHCHMALRPFLTAATAATRRCFIAAVAGRDITRQCSRFSVDCLHLHAAIARRAGSDAPIYLANVTMAREHFYESQRFPWLDDLTRELRYAVRSLWKQPAFSAVAVLTLALGIGANTAVFSVLSAAVLHPLRYPEPDRLMMLRDRQSSTSETNVSYPEFVDWRTHSADIAEVAAVFNATHTVGGTEPHTVMAQRVSANLFQTIGLSPLMGRHFHYAEEAPSGGRVVAVSQAFWERELASDAHVIGRVLTLDDTPHTIVAVMPRDFRGVLPRDSFGVQPKDLWLPLRLDEATAPRGMHVMTVVARLRSGITQDQGRERLEAMALGLKHEGRTTHGLAAYSLIRVVAESARPMLLALTGAVAMVLLMACANLANLMLARGTARRQRDCDSYRHRRGSSMDSVRASGRGVRAGWRWKRGGTRLGDGCPSLVSEYRSYQRRQSLLWCGLIPRAGLYGIATSCASRTYCSLWRQRSRLSERVQPLLRESGRTTTGRPECDACWSPSKRIVGRAAGRRRIAGAIVRQRSRDDRGDSMRRVHCRSMFQHRGRTCKPTGTDSFSRIYWRASPPIRMSRSPGLVNELPLGGGGVSGETPIEGKAFPATECR